MFAVPELMQLLELLDDGKWPDYSGRDYRKITMWQDKLIQMVQQMSMPPPPVNNPDNPEGPKDPQTPDGQ